MGREREDRGGTERDVEGERGDVEREREKERGDGERKMRGREKERGGMREGSNYKPVLMFECICCTL